MANKKISEFNTATAADPTDLLLIQRGSGNFSLAIDTLNLSSALTVQDTGVDVETGVTNIDFIGGGVVVTSAGSGAVTVDVSAAGVSDWIDLSDTPVAYAGFAGYATRVNGGESGLEFFDFDPTVRGLISIAPGSSSHLGYDNSTGEISIKALGITSVTVNGSATSLANFVATFYTVGTEFQEGDTIILNGVPSGQEVYMHNGGTAVTVADFTLLEQPQVVTYTGLTDTPGTFAGDGNKFLRVNAGASAVEHVAASAINVGDFNDDGTYLTAVTGTASRISVSGGSAIDIDAAYVGQTSITTLGTIGTGTWNASTIDETVGGTGQTTYATGDILYASGANTLAKLAAGTDTHVLTLVGGVPVWAAAAGGSWSDALAAGNTSGANDAIFSKTGTATSAATQVGSQSLFFQSSLWDGAVEEVNLWEIKSNPSSSISRDDHLSTYYKGVRKGGWGFDVTVPTQNIFYVGDLDISDVWNSVSGKYSYLAGGSVLASNTNTRIAIAGGVNTWADVSANRHGGGDCQIRFNVNGSPKLWISSQSTVYSPSGVKWGIGTTSPTGDLHVVGGAGQSPLTIDTNSIPNALTVDFNGNVRVNGSSGLANLHVNGTGRFQSQLYVVTAGGTSFRVDNSTRSHALHVTELALVGIEESNPEAKLHVSGNGIDTFRVDTSGILNNFLIDSSGRIGIIQSAPTADLHLPASDTINAPLRIPHGVAPTAPNDGDIWTTTTSAYARINGVTVDLAGGGGADGNGIYDGSGSLSGATTVTMGGNQITWSGGDNEFVGNVATSGSSKGFYLDALTLSGHNGRFFSDSGQAKLEMEAWTAGGLTGQIALNTSGNSPWITWSTTSGTTATTEMFIGSWVNSDNSGGYGLRTENKTFALNTGGGGGTSALRVLTGNGNVGINVLSPSSRLHVVGGSGQSPLSVDTNSIPNAFAIAGDGDWTGNFAGTGNITLTATGARDFIYGIVNTNTGHRNRFYLEGNSTKRLHLFTWGSASGFNHSSFQNKGALVGTDMPLRIGLAGAAATTLEFFTDAGTSLSSPNIRATMDVNGKWGFRVAPTNAFVSIAASATGAAHLNLAPGVAPTTPNNGDIWFDGTNLNIRISGVTRTINVT